MPEKLGLGATRGPKKSNKEVKEIKQIVHDLHSRKDVVKMTIETPRTLYKEIKLKLVQEDIPSLREYILGLIEQDLLKR